MLARTTRDEMLRPWIVADEDWKEAQGLCLYWRRHGDERYVGHAGGLHGFITRFALSPKDGVGAIALLNGMGDAEALAFDLLDLAVAAQRARPLPQPAPPAKLPGRLRAAARPLRLGGVRRRPDGRVARRRAGAGGR